MLKKVTNLYMSIPFKSRQYIKINNLSALTQILCEAGEGFISGFKPTDGDMVHEEAENVNGSLDIEDIERMNYINNKCYNALMKNERYNYLSDKSIELFNILKRSVDYINVLFEYEDIASQKQDIIEVEAYNLGKYDS